MDFSEIMNIILSGGLVGTAAAIGSLRATVRKAKAEAMKPKPTRKVCVWTTRNMPPAFW